MSSRPRAADDFDVIRARLHELQSGRGHQAADIESFAAPNGWYYRPLSERAVHVISRIGWKMVPNCHPELWFGPVTVPPGEFERLGEEPPYVVRQLEMLPIVLIGKVRL